MDDTCFTFVTHFSKLASKSSNGVVVGGRESNADMKKWLQAPPGGAFQGDGRVAPRLSV